MVGPFMQGFLLMGIIYWYSKGMMSLINDYYRNEFQRKLKTENPKSIQKYDIDNMDELIKFADTNFLKKDDGLNKPTNQQQNQQHSSDFHNTQYVGKIEVPNDFNESTTMGFCYKSNSIEVFMNLIHLDDYCNQMDLTLTKRTQQYEKSHYKDKISTVI